MISNNKITLPETFFKSLWREEYQGYLPVWNKSNKNTRFLTYREISEAIPMILEEARDSDIYFSLGLVGDNTIKGRGKAEDVIAIPGLWLDIDVGRESYSTKNCPPDMEAAMKIVNEFPAVPTITVNSGHGLQLYYLFDTPMVFDNASERKLAEQLLKNFQSFFIKKALSYGYSMYKTGDLARALRIPGTYNHKGEIVEVTVIDNNSDKEEFRYNPEYIKSLISGSGNSNAINQNIIKSTPPKEEIYREWVELAKDTSYTINESGFLCAYNKDEELYTIANFIARVSKEITIDDGVEISKSFVIDGVLSGGVPLPTIEVSAASFDSLDWLIPSWGIRANIMNVYNGKNSVRCAIQCFSEKTVIRETKYTHIGWRKIQDKYVYLHSGGCIGAENITVEVDAFLGSYALPDHDDNPVESMKASLNLLKIAPLDATLPLLCTIYLAPLLEPFRLANIEPNFLLWLHGETGSRKTTIANLFLSHFREYSKSPPATFNDTINSLEKKAFLCKDSLLFIDDFFPGDSRQEKEQMRQTAQHLIRYYGDKVGRSRMRTDTSIRNSCAPRGMALITGEDFITGHSSVARCLGIELNKDDVNLDLLSEAQNSPEMLSRAMFGYLEWLSSMFEALPEYLHKEFIKVRDTLRGIDNHGRMLETVAWLQTAYKIMLKYAEHLGIMNKEEATARLSESLDLFISLITSMHDAMNEEKPHILFIKFLSSMLASCQYKVTELHGKDTDTYNLPHIGWGDQDFLYLIPEATYNGVWKEMQKQNRTFPLTMTAFLKDLDGAGLIKTEKYVSNGKDKVSRTVKKAIDNKRIRVIQIYRNKMDDLLDISQEGKK